MILTNNTMSHQKAKIDNIYIIYIVKNPERTTFAVKKWSIIQESYVDFSWIYKVFGNIKNTKKCLLKTENFCWHFFL